MTVSMIIGGGQSSRMGQDKSRLEIAERTLLERTIDALSFVDQICVVAAERELGAAANWPPISFTLEDPIHGGPVAGLAAGVAAFSELADDQQVIILPVDMPEPRQAAARLREADLAGLQGEAGTVGGAVDGAVLEDEAGWPQYLLGRYRLGALRRALAELGDPRNVSMRKFGRLLNVAHIPVSNIELADVDTPEDARAHGIKIKKHKRKDDPEVLARLEKWQIALRKELAISDHAFDQEKILDLAAVIAERVARPGVPVTAYIVGVAVGQAIETGSDPVEALARALEIAENPERLLGTD